MFWIALKMLTGNPGRFYPMVFGIAFACMLMTQQIAIFVGLMRNTTSVIRDTQGADIWVMDPSVQFINDITPLSDDAVLQVRGVPGVAWAVRFYNRGVGRAQFKDGLFKEFYVLGLDDDTLVGAPQTMLLGSLADLGRPDAVIMDELGYRYLWPNQPLELGKTFEMNDRRAEVVGICEASPTLQTMPLIYTRYSRAIRYGSQERRCVSFVLAKTEPDADITTVCERIRQQTGLLALSNDSFTWTTVWYYLRRNGIAINFGTTVLLGFLIGASITGQAFYIFTINNLKQFGAVKAMGATNSRIVGMVLLQGLFVGVTGYGLGLGMATLFDLVMKLRITSICLDSYMTWEILVGTAIAVAVIVVSAAVASLGRVLRLEPLEVFK